MAKHGLWCRNTPGGDADQSLESRSQSAAIKYWKIDIGDPTFNLVRLRNKTHIPLTLEHVHGECAREWRLEKGWPIRLATMGFQASGDPAAHRCL